MDHCADHARCQALSGWSPGPIRAAAAHLEGVLRRSGKAQRTARCRAANPRGHICAKHEHVKKRGLGANPTELPFQARHVLADLRGRVDKEHQRLLRLRELAQIMGIPRSTVHFWFSASRDPHLPGFLALLEQLAEPERQAFIGFHCRALPTLNHPALAGATDALRELLVHQAGAVLITGRSNYARAFLLTACGHSFIRTSGSLPAGLDLEPSGKLVPVRGIRYADPRLETGGAKALALAHWPRILTAKAPLLLLNGVWSAAPELGVDFVRLAATRQLILAEPTAPEPARLRAFDALHLVTVSQGPGQAASIRATCRRFAP